MKKSQTSVKKNANLISPLQLKDYSLIQLHVEANPEFRPPQTGEYKGSFGVNFDFRRQEGSKVFRVDLNIVVNSQKEVFINSPYRIQILLQAVLEFEGDYPEDQIPHLLGPNGLAMTYAIARGIVGQATGTSLHGKFILPTVNFVELLRKKLKSETKERNLKTNI